jgi:hypothetical protein
MAGIDVKQYMAKQHARTAYANWDLAEQRQYHRAHKRGT